MYLKGIIGLIAASAVAAAVQVDGDSRKSRAADPFLYEDGTKPSTDWTVSNEILLKTPAFHGGPMPEFSGSSMEEAYGKIMAMNPSWNCTVPGGCPDESVPSKLSKLSKRAHGQVVLHPFHHPRTKPSPFTYRQLQR